MASSVLVEKRRAKIVQLLSERGAVSVAELGTELGVSDITIRRDLEQLQEEGRVERRHGGAQAMPPQAELQPERILDEKGVTNMAQKTRIAAAAAALVEPDDVVFMNSGSTILCLLRAIRGKRVRVITNNAAAIDEELDPSIDLMILGGEYRQQSKSLVGEFALNTLKDIWSTHTFLGTNGVSLEKGLTTSVHQECSVNQAMIRNTHGKVVVLADSSKMGKVANFISSPLSSIDLIITDSDCPAEYLRLIEESGIEVIVV